MEPISDSNHPFLFEYYKVIKVQGRSQQHGAGGTQDKKWIPVAIQTQKSQAAKCCIKRVQNKVCPQPSRSSRIERGTHQQM